jgi:HEAT repeat protein
MVSSTYLDLREERSAIRSVIEDLGRGGREVAWVGMEEIGATPSSPEQVSVAMAEQADLMILLLGKRYGTVPSDETLSLTNQEYETIHREKIPCLAYVADVEAGEVFDPRVAAFRRRVQDEVTAKPYSDLRGLAKQFRMDLEAWLATFATSPGTNAHGLDSPPGPPPAQFVDREDELAAVDQGLVSARARIGVWGPPGYGKTALIQRYFEGHSQRLHDPLWLRVDDLFGRDSQGRPRFGAMRWEKEALLQRLLEIAAERPRIVLVFDNVQAAPILVSWLAGRLGDVPALFLSWDSASLPPCRLISVPLLPAESADELIAAACAADQVSDAVEIRLLCERLENHPLLLDLAARRLRLTPSLTISELIKELEAAANRLALEGPALDGRIVQVRSMLLSTYRSMEVVERRVLSALAAAPPSGISPATMDWALRTVGRGELQRLDRAEHLGLLEGRTIPDWRGHRFRLRSLIRDFLLTTDAFQEGKTAFDAYLMKPDSLYDGSVECVALALERQLAAAAPRLPEADWVEPLLVMASPAIRERVHLVLSQVTDRAQLARIAERVAAVLEEPCSEDVAIELLGAFELWRIPQSEGLLTQLWRDPEVTRTESGRYLSRLVQAAAAQALAALAGLNLSDFLLARIHGAYQPDREGAIEVAATNKVLEARPAVVECLDDPSPVIRRIAVDGLADYDPDPATRDRLWQLFETDPDERVRWRAANSLGVWRDKRVADFFLRRLDENDPDTRGEACSVLWRFRSPRAADRLAQLAQHDPEPEIRGTATFVLADWNDPRASSICLERLNGPETYERTVAAGMIVRLAGLGAISDKLTIPISDELASWLDDERSTLRLLARAALAALEDQRCYAGLWSDVSWEVSAGEGPYRWFVIMQLAGWLPEGFEPLRLRPLLNDRDPDMRSSAALVAGQVRSRDLVPDLQLLLEDQSVGSLAPVAKEASEALDRIAGKRPPWKPTARESPFAA